MNVPFAVLADYANVTQEGKLNIMGLFDIIYASQFPVKHREMQLVMRFEADISERNQQKNARVRLIDGYGQQMIELRGLITVGDQQISGEALYFNQVLTFWNIEFPREGTYQFDIYIDGGLKKSVQLKVLAFNVERKA